MGGIEREGREASQRGSLEREGETGVEVKILSFFSCAKFADFDFMIIMIF